MHKVRHKPASGALRICPRRRFYGHVEPRNGWLDATNTIAALEAPPNQNYKHHEHAIGVRLYGLAPARFRTRSSDSDCSVLCARIWARGLAWAPNHFACSSSEPDNRSTTWNNCHSSELPDSGPIRTCERSQCTSRKRAELLFKVRMPGSRPSRKTPWC